MVKGELPPRAQGEQAVRVLGGLGVISAESRAADESDTRTLRMSWEGYKGHALPMIARVLDVQDKGSPVPEPYTRTTEEGEETDWLPPERYVVHDVISDGRRVSVYVREETDLEAARIYSIDLTTVAPAEGVDRAILEAHRNGDMPESE